MPRSRSISIQSETVPLRPSLACTAPARIMTRACRASASVSVDFPASGWLITANDLRLPACPTDSGTALRAVDGTALVVLIGLRSSAQYYVLRCRPLTSPGQPADTVVPEGSGAKPDHPRHVARILDPRHDSATLSTSVRHRAPRH